MDSDQAGRVRHWVRRREWACVCHDQGHCQRGQGLTLIAFNIICLALVGAAFGEGYVQQVIDGDSTGMVWAIAAVHVLGLAFTFRKAAGLRGTKPTQFAMRAHLAPLRYVSGTLVLMGLIGTVLGFIMALQGIRADAAGDVAAVTDMVNQLVRGMGVALYTTLVGSIFSAWITVNWQILNMRAARMIASA